MKVHMPAPDLIRRNLACSLAAVSSGLDTGQADQGSGCCLCLLHKSQEYGWFKTLLGSPGLLSPCFPHPSEPFQPDFRHSFSV